MAMSARAKVMRTASLTAVASLVLFLGPAPAGDEPPKAGSASPAAVSAPLNYFTVTPCRVVDTRTAGGPLVAGVERTITFAGTCGIPATAAAVSINVAVVGPTAPGNVRLYPAGSPVPTVSTINYATGQTRTNNAIIALGTGGAVAALVQPGGSTHLILDVNGYASPGAGIGAPCGASFECASTFCVDGVCCDGACTGLCSACTAAAKGSGSDGVCGSIGQGTDPDNECTQQAASSCGNNGSCNGSGACQLWASGTVCAAQSCTSGVQTNASTCNGSGTCLANGTTSCGAYACNAGGSACLTSCTLNTDCAAGNVCISGTCQDFSSCACIPGDTCCQHQEGAGCSDASCQPSGRVCGRIYTCTSDCQGWTQTGPIQCRSNCDPGTCPF